MFSKSSVGGLAAGLDSNSAILALSSSISLLSSTSFSVGCGSAGSSTGAGAGSSIGAGVGSSIGEGVVSSTGAGAGVCSSNFGVYSIRTSKPSPNVTLPSSSTVILYLNNLFYQVYLA